MSDQPLAQRGASAEGGVVFVSVKFICHRCWTCPALIAKDARVIRLDMVLSGYGDLELDALRQSLSVRLGTEGAKR